MTETKLSLEDSCRRLKENDCSLTTLDLSGIVLGDAGCMALAFALKSNEFLKELNLANTGIGPSGATKLAAAFKSNYTIERLYLMGNSVGDKGAESIAGALKTNGSLRLLNLARNLIGDIGSAALAEALEENTALYKLYLYENNIGNHGAAALAETILHNRNLQELFLWENKIGSDGLDELERAFTSVQKDGTGTSCIQLRTQWKLNVKPSQPSQAQAKPKMKTVDGDIVARLKSRAIQLEVQDDAAPALNDEKQLYDCREKSVLPAQSFNSFAQLRAKAQSLEVERQSISPKKPEPNRQSAFALLRAKAQELEQKSGGLIVDAPSSQQAQSSKVLRTLKAEDKKITDVAPFTAQSSPKITETMHNDEADGKTFSFADLRAKAKALEMQQAATRTGKPSIINTHELRSRAKQVEVNLAAASPKQSSLSVSKIELQSKVKAVEKEHSESSFPTLATNVSVRTLQAKAKSVTECVSKEESSKRSSININFEELRDKARALEKQVTTQLRPKLVDSNPTSSQPPALSASAVSPPLQASGPAVHVVGGEKALAFSQLLAKAAANQNSSPPPIKTSVSAVSAGLPASGRDIPVVDEEKPLAFSQLLAKAAALETRAPHSSKYPGK